MDFSNGFTSNTFWNTLWISRKFHQVHVELNRILFTDSRKVLIKITPYKTPTKHQITSQISNKSRFEPSKKYNSAPNEKKKQKEPLPTSAPSYSSPTPSHSKNHAPAQSLKYLPANPFPIAKNPRAPRTGKSMKRSRSCRTRTTRATSAITQSEDKQRDAREYYTTAVV